MGNGSFLGWDMISLEKYFVDASKSPRGSLGKKKSKTHSIRNWDALPMGFLQLTVLFFFAI
jgi:hypothetical protein